MRQLVGQGKSWRTHEIMVFFIHRIAEPTDSRSRLFLAGLPVHIAEEHLGQPFRIPQHRDRIERLHIAVRSDGNDGTPAPSHTFEQAVEGTCTGSDSLGRGGWSSCPAAAGSVPGPGDVRPRTRRRPRRRASGEGHRRMAVVTIAMRCCESLANCARARILVCSGVWCSSWPC